MKIKKGKAKTAKVKIYFRQCMNQWRRGFNVKNLKDIYISEISKASNRYGNLLIELMDKYNAKNLREITEEQAITFYNERVKEKTQWITK